MDTDRSLQVQHKELEQKEGWEGKNSSALLGRSEKASCRRWYLSWAYTLIGEWKEGNEWCRPGVQRQKNSRTKGTSYRVIVNRVQGLKL